MRNFVKTILFLGVGVFFFTSCEEDTFTEKDAMEELQHIDVMLNVTDGSSYSEAIEGATVQIAGDSIASSKTTNDAGSVVFNDVQVGSNLSVYVQKDGFTKAVYNISTLTDSYRENIITENLKIYSLSGENMATVKGQLTIETDLTNREREILAGEEVRVINNSLEGNNSRSFVGTTDEEGHYSIQVPVTSEGDDYLDVKFPSLIEKRQAIAMEKEDGTYQVDTVAASFTFSNYDYSEIDDDIASAYAVVDAPQGNGTGFELGVEPHPTPFSEYSDIEILKGGSGYSQDTLSLSVGENGLAASIIVRVDANGAIDDIDFEGYYYDQETGNYVSFDNGALYTSKPELDLSSLEGSGAELDIQFESEYKVFVKDNGEGYFGIPTVSAEYKDYEGDVIAQRFDQDINSNNELLDYSYNGLNQYLTINGGTIYPKSGYAYDGDTLFVTQGLVEVTALNVSETSAEPAAVDFSINGDGEINFYSIQESGSGYDPANPPAVTIHSIAGYGSGAEVKAEVNTNGSLYALEINNGGEGYIRNVNDYDGDGFSTNNRGENASLSIGYIGSSGETYINNVSAGDVETRDLFYGTGIRK